MKKVMFILLLLAIVHTVLTAQAPNPKAKDQTAITTLIAQYAQARKEQDTTLLKSILTEDIDQLVSSGEWRRGVRTAVAGMQRSSNRNPGTRTLTVDNIRFLKSKTAIADCRYVIDNPDGTTRKMWSTFVVQKEKGQWRIAAIRNMLPAGG